MDKRRIGIRIQLSTVFAVGMVLVALVLVALDFVQTRSYLLEFARKEMALAEHAIHARAGRYFEPVASAAETLVAAGAESFSADHGNGRFFRIAERLLTRYPQIYGIYGDFPDGTFIKVGHLTERIRLEANIPKAIAQLTLRSRVGPRSDPREPATITWRYREAEARRGRSGPAIRASTRASGRGTARQDPVQGFIGQMSISGPQVFPASPCSRRCAMAIRALSAPSASTCG